MTAEHVTPEHEKQVAAAAAASLVEDGMTLGLGTGSTVAHLLGALARRAPDVRCVATSPRTEVAAQRLGLRVVPFGSIDRFDLAIDGADQVAADGWLVKGGGAAHTREKVVAATADRFVVVVDSSKPVDHLRPPVPLELLPYGLASTLRRLAALGPVILRDVGESPDGGVIADLHAPIGEPHALADRLGRVPGLVEHGLFGPEMVSAVVVGRGDAVEWRSQAPPAGAGTA
ncbi:MAG: ribose 5-phosphate isomerase A [Acidimicrobiales bacterium]